VEFHINCLSYTKLLNIIDFSIKNRNNQSIGYLNFNLCLLALKNKYFRDSINSFSIIHPDGIGVIWAIKLNVKNKKISRISGSDFYRMLLEKCEEKKWRILFYGGSDENAVKLNDVLKIKYPELQISGIYSRNKSDFVNNLSIDKKEADILMVGLGTPEQEDFINNKTNDINIPVKIAVGSGIDFLSENLKRAPFWMQKIGLEWLFRLIQEPKRLWKRYIIGIPIFIFYVLIQKIKLVVNESEK